MIIEPPIIVYQFKLPPEVVADNEAVPPTLMVDEPVTETVGVGGVLETVNEEVLVPVPPGLVTEMVPLVAAGTTAVICVEFTILKEVASTPLNLTDVADVKFAPLMVTVEPTQEEEGENDEIVAAGIFSIVKSSK